jgi:hypothetical protein
VYGTIKVKTETETETDFVDVAVEDLKLEISRKARGLFLDEQNLFLD